MDFPTSIWTVILSVKDNPERVKDLIIRRYREPVYEFLRMKGLTHEDAEDVTQEVFIQICREDFLKKADRDKGKFRTLLQAVTRNLLAFFHRYNMAERRDRRRKVTLGELDLPSETASDGEFDQLWVKNLVSQAMDRLKDDPMIIALRRQMEGRTYQEIATELGRQVHDVTNYIHRGKTRLRAEIERMIADYSSKEDVPEEVAHLIKLV
ncbi:MAG TPA: sigma-70 family RNA polymerase sigma factor [Planctomycetota bacterium]|nr:sigma-70 family RNA polymerase sigma factor [Planctomycetota bacterium]